MFNCSTAVRRSFSIASIEVAKDRNKLTTSITEKQNELVAIQVFKNYTQIHTTHTHIQAHQSNFLKGKIMTASQNSEILHEIIQIKTGKHTIHPVLP